MTIVRAGRRGGVPGARIAPDEAFIRDWGSLLELEPCNFVYLLLYLVITNPDGVDE